MLRSHTCGELNTHAIDTTVTLCGWVANKRNHGGVIFIDLRDRYGITQVVFEPSVSDENAVIAERIPRESVILAKGVVRPRPQGQENEKLSTGGIEIRVDTLSVLSESTILPIETDDFHEANEDVRLRYRFLDLRRPSMQRNIMKRAHVMKVMHDYFSENGFVNIETPLLMRATPEGARDFIVPSRIHKGSVYALPQSPQLYKQISMISGFDKYYQIAKCLRDEDLRADRQPEFTQLDIEMSFIDEEDIMKVIEDLFVRITHEVFDKKISAPFERLTYREAISLYGTDKPDTRFDLRIVDVSDMMKGSGFNVFESVLSSGGAIKGICVENPGFSRKDIDEIVLFAQRNKAKGLAWMRVSQGVLESNIVKFFSADQQSAIRSAFSAKEGDVLFFAADSESLALEVLGKVRSHLGSKLSLYDADELRFVWITQFPFFEWNDESKSFVAAHHPFTSPHPDDVDLVESDKGSVRARAYDICLNGWEVGSGSIRIHDAALQHRMFRALDLSEEDIERKFGWFLESLKYGVPPHGGIAPGLDRLVALMLGHDNIREVIAFPKNKSAQSPMDGAPSPVEAHQLGDVGLSLSKK